MTLSNVIFGFQCVLQHSWREHLFMVIHSIKSDYHHSSLGSLLHSPFSILMHFNHLHNLRIILSYI